MLDRSHLSLFQEDDIDELGLGAPTVDQHVVIHVPVSDLILEHSLEDALALGGPDLKQESTLVESLKSLTYNLHLENRKIFSFRGDWVVGAVRLYAEQIKF